MYVVSWHTAALGLRPLQMTTGPEGSAAGRREKAQTPAPGGRSQKFLREGKRLQGKGARETQGGGEGGVQASELRILPGEGDISGTDLTPSLSLLNHTLTAPQNQLTRPESLPAKTHPEVACALKERLQTQVTG